MPVFLKPDSQREVLGVKIKKKIIPIDAKITKPTDGILQDSFFRSQQKLQGPTTLTIHNTGDIIPANGTSRSEQYARATHPNGNMGVVRVHFWVCLEEVWQQLEEDEVAWHAGTYAGNSTSLSIEIIGASAKATDNGARLAADILHRHGWGIDKLRTHSYWFGKPDYIVNDGYKNCPYYIMAGMGWTAFKNLVNGYLKQLQQAGQPVPTPTPTPTPTPPVTGDAIWRVQIGAWRTKSLAETAYKRLKADGYDAWMYDDDGIFRVQAGAFAVRSNADQFEAALKKKGYQTWVIQIGTTGPGISKEPVVLEIQVGDRVTVNKGATDILGGKLASFVFNTTYTVMERNGARVVFGLDGVITAAVDVKYLTKV